MSIKQDIIDYAYARTWYSNAHIVLENLFGKQADFMANLIAAISPQTVLSRNWQLTIRIYTDLQTGAKPNLTGLSKSQRMNVERVIRGEHLQGNKVCNFAANLKGDYQAVTIDTWILRYIGWDKSYFPQRDKIYNKIANRIRKLARRYNLQPAELQAILWTACRDKHNEHFTDFFLIAGILPF